MAGRAHEPFHQQMTANRSLRAFLFVLIIFATMSTTSSAVRPLRCYTLCTRSESDLRCRRCRFREPMRFGKRVDPSTAVEMDREQSLEDIAGKLDDNVPLSQDHATERPSNNQHSRTYSFQLLDDRQARDLDHLMDTVARLTAHSGSKVKARQDYRTWRQKINWM